MRRVRIRKLIFGALVGVAVALVLAQVYYLSVQRGIAQVVDTAQGTAQARAGALASEVAHQRSVVAILAGDRDVSDALDDPTHAKERALSIKLAALREQAGSSVLYIVNTQGMAVAASNWDFPDSFIGTSYAYRAYVEQALRTGEGQEYALGSVSRRPGLYLSRRVENAGHAVGVVIAKIEFAQMERSWDRRDSLTFVTDNAGRITLTTNNSLRFQTIPPLPVDTMRLEQPVEGTDWILYAQVPLRDVKTQAAMVTLAVASGFVPIGILLRFLLRRRRRALDRARAEASYRRDLEREVETRTCELSGEIAERKDAERRLAEMQSHLVQANRLATLGQVTAGVAHEVNQPLATIRLLAENAQAMMDMPAARNDVAENLGQIVRMTDRIETITSELRGFSRKGDGGTGVASFSEAWEASMLLSASRRVADRVNMVEPNIPRGLMVMANKVRLEQVLVNLLQNAHEALIDTAHPEIHVTLRRWRDEAGQRWVTCTVADNGPGLTAEVAQNLFSPFLTTKPHGLGLGLVISQGIVRNFGGRLRVDATGPGARFHIDMKEAS